MTITSQDDTLSLQRTLSLTRRRSFRSGYGRDDRGWTPLHIVARRGDLKQVKRLLDKGMDVNTPAWGHKAKGTPLHSAAKERNREAVKFLIENGAFLSEDINDCRFNPPLHYCSGLEWAYEEMKRLQLENPSSSEVSSSSES